MNSTATIVEFKRFKKVCFYSLRFEGADKMEAEKFFEKVEVLKEYEEYVNNLIDWIIDIGDNRGAIYDLFRDEKVAVALPPPRGKLNRSNFVKDLRLYCYWVSKDVVILFNGGVKTKIDPTKCPNVSMHFHNANSWSKQLQEYEMDVEGQKINDIENIFIDG